jgi:DNA-binding CsgD family transcriptional regulator
VTLAVRVGLARSLGAYLVGNLAEPLIRLGRWREALDLITESLAEEPSGVFASTLTLQRAELRMWQGDPAAAEDLREARRQFGDAADMQFTGPMAFIEAELARAAGDLGAARRLVQTPLGMPRGTVLRYLWPLVWLGTRIEADAAEREADSGAEPEPDIGRHRDELRTLATTLPAKNPPARAYQALAAAETARMRRGDRVTAWQEAVAATRAAGEAFPLSYSLFRLAEAQCVSGQSEAATATVRECLEVADDAAAAIADDARALARRARLRVEPAASARAGTSEAGAEVRFQLTDREREVLALVSEGRSNGQIAAALFISPKTASVHVSNILAKLGVSSRVEAAALAHRLGLVPAT